MLVLSRKLGEVVVASECEMTVTVLSVNGKTPQLGVDAPIDIDRYREEIWQTMKLKMDRPTMKE